MFTTLMKAAGASAVTLAIGAAAPAMAQENYPSEDIDLIIPFGAGGGSDTLARTIKSVIEELDLIPVQILPENRPGGSGAIGYGSVAQQQGDPHTMATVSVSFFTTPLLGASPTDYTEFTPLAAIATSPYILAVPSDSEYEEFADLGETERLTTGTVGVVSDAALLAEMVSDALDITVDPVPFDGEGEVMAAVLGGHVDFVFLNPSEVLSQIEAGELRPLAVSSEERVDALPDVPTFSELGHDIVHTQLRGLVMPGGVSDEVVAYWEDVLSQVAESPEWREGYVAKYHNTPNYLDSEAFGAAIEQTSNRYETLMRNLDIIE